MPRIELIPQVFYNANDPIHWDYDNIPLKAIIERQNLINLALDNVIEQMRDAIGTQGSLSNRLNQSIDANGDIKKEAIDQANHSIESHEDTPNYVRMTREQSDKLSQIQDNATSLKAKVFIDETNYVEVSTDFIEMKSSNTIKTSFEAPNIIRYDLNIPIEFAHRHYSNIIPTSVDIISDYMHYKTTNTVNPLPFISGSLKVYINGIRIFQEKEVYVPGFTMDAPWILLKFHSNPDFGVFTLSAPISDDDVIYIDFDILLN